MTELALIERYISFGYHGYAYAASEHMCCDVSHTMELGLAWGELDSRCRSAYS